MRLSMPYTGAVTTPGPGPAGPLNVKLRLIYLRHFNNYYCLARILISTNLQIYFALLTKLICPNLHPLFRDHGRTATLMGVVVCLLTVAHCLHSDETETLTGSCKLITGMDFANHYAKLEPFLLMAKSLKGAAAAKLIHDATSAPAVFVFSELLELPNIQEVRRYCILVSNLLMCDSARKKRAASQVFCFAPVVFLQNISGLHSYAFLYRSKALCLQ